MARYAFVPFTRLDPERRALPDHARLRGLSGVLEGTITTLTPFYTRGRPGHPDHVCERPGAPFQIAGRPAIPGSALKGMIRSVVEAIAPGGACLGHDVKRDLQSRRPPGLRPCTDPMRLCIACRSFGRTLGQGGYQGRVMIEDAIADPGFVIDDRMIKLRGLYSPRPEVAAAYYDENGQMVGRKFYPHPPADQNVPIDGSTNPNDTNELDVRLVRQAAFRLRLRFDGLAVEEAALLLDALLLDESTAHKLGLGKPLGLGSVRITLERVTLYADRARRGTGEGVDPALLRDAGAGASGIGGELLAHLAALRSADNPARGALTSVWRWPGLEPLTPI